MSKYLLKLSVRAIWHNKILFALVLLSVAIGVAVSVGMDLAIDSSNRAFENSTESLTGQSTHFVHAGDIGLDEDVYFSLRKTNIPMTPIVRFEAYVDGFGRKPFTVLGLDPFSEAPFRSYFQNSIEQDPNYLKDFLLKSGSVVVSQSMADRLGVSLKDTLKVQVNGKDKMLSFDLILKPSQNLNKRYLKDLILMDISNAQELSDQVALLSYIDLKLDKKNKAEQLSKLKNILPQGLLIEQSKSRTRTLNEMSKAFRLNMTALSLLGLLVGMFLIWSTISFTMLRRKREFSMLRAFGFQTSQTFALIILQSFVLGLMGSLLGIALGVFLGKFLVWILSQTISDLFFVVHVNSVSIHASTLIKGLLLGVLTSTIAALLPAFEVASIEPSLGLSKMHGQSFHKKHYFILSLLAIILMCFSCAAIYFYSRSLLISLLATLGVILSFALCMPLLAFALILLLKTFSIKLTHQLGSLRLLSSLKRTAIPMAALMIALAMVVGISGMIGSFRHTVIVWLDQQLKGDVYIAVPNQGPGRALAKLDPKVRQYIEHQKEIDSIDFLKISRVLSDKGNVQLMALSGKSFDNEKSFLNSTVKAEKVWNELNKPGNIIISEPLAYRWKIKKAGGSINLMTPKGMQAFKVIAIYYDYASSQGSLCMSMQQYRSIWQDKSVNGMAVYLKNGFDPDVLSQKWQEHLKQEQNLDIKPNKHIRKEVFEVFDRTFVVTQALKWLAVFVAFVGIISSLLSQVVENLREYGLLRALGFKRIQIAMQILTESLSLGLISWLMSVPLGYLLSYLMIYVINYRSFGWTLQMQMPSTIFVNTFMLSILASVIAAIYPSIMMFKLKPMDTLRIDA